MSEIKIILNGQDFYCEEKTSIKGLIEKLDLDIKKIAVEKNYQIIFPKDFGKNILCSGDKIEIVHFIGGG